MEKYRITLENLDKQNMSMNEGLTILLVLRGELSVTVNAGSFALSGNDLLVLNHRDIYALEKLTENAVLSLKLSPEFLSGLFPPGCMPRYRCAPQLITPDLEACCHSLKSRTAHAAFLYFKQDEHYKLLLCSELLKILHLLSTNFPDELPAHELKEGVSENTRLSSILNFVHQNYKNRISLEALAKQEYTSVQYLSRLFRQKMGVTFSEYLNGLRLESAVSELLYTSNSITQVALGSGFSGIKAFNAQFKKRFACSPLEYRRRHPMETESAGVLKSEPPASVSESSLEDLIRFLRIYDFSRETENACKLICNTQTESEENFPALTRILAAGSASNLLRQDIREEIRAVREEIGFDYICVEDLSLPSGNALPHPLLGLYDYFELVSFLDRMELGLFLTLDAEALLESRDRKGGFPRLMFLKQLASHSVRKPDKPWHFELTGNALHIEEVYLSFTRCLEELLPGCQIGVRLPSGPLPGEGAELLTVLKSRRPPDFLTFSTDPNLPERPDDSAVFEKLQRDYYRTFADDIRQLREETGLSVPCYLMDWNTLTGRSTVEAGEFHRTALIADTLLCIRGKLQGVGIRLHLLDVNNVPKDCLPTYSLSLFLHRSIRRPAFYIFKYMDCLSSLIIRSGDGFLLTRASRSQYTLLLYNSSYMDPFYSLDNIRESVFSRSFRITLKNLPSGRYRIKKILLDKDNGSLYRSWIDVDFTNPVDDDINEYLENASRPNISLYEREVAGSFTIHETLTLNAVSFYLIKKVSS